MIDVNVLRVGVEFGNETSEKGKKGRREYRDYIIAKPSGIDGRVCTGTR